ncbi:uncharacterized protein LOC129971504 [Argiope bruennichi]|uniref:uncharacterized protein LOC129971504 n=1 Tax=Argiope bruennichi TaxID=94029 RepID=UPI00249465C4|nr:uncharacterized protein LOC129971504 [Argiope bruennichi]
MATATFLNFLRYPHGRAIDGINYEMVKCIVCPKCWLKYIYQYITLLLMVIAAWFAIGTKNIGASLVIVVFVFVFLSTSEILVPRLLPGTIRCQDIPFPPQSGEMIKFFEFMRLVFRYTCEESKERFWKAEATEEETENEIESDDYLFLQRNSRNSLQLDESIESVYYYRKEFEEREYEDTMLHQRDSKNNLLHLDESAESVCHRQEFEEHEYEAIMLHQIDFKNNLLHPDETIEKACHRQEFERDHELEATLLRRPLFEGERAAEANLRHRPLFENGLLRRPLSEGEYGSNLLRRQMMKNYPFHRSVSEGESDGGLFRRALFEGRLIRLQILEGE